VFVVEQNRYAQSTPFERVHAGSLARRAEPFGIPVTSCDGMDVLGVCAAARQVVGRVRGEQVPHVLFLETYRFGPHSKGDDVRDPEEIARWKQRDPVEILRASLDAEACRSAQDAATAEVAALLQAWEIQP
jgi:TPP-dependent pyruvate/acetoin dehydrogenase alpha subunit